MIGVNAQIQSDSGGSDGVGFAIPSNTVRSVVAQIVAGKTVAHAYLGVQVRDSSSPVGAALAQVLPGTPAAKAGLKAGDVVTKLDGTTDRGDAATSPTVDRREEARRHDEGHLRSAAARRAPSTVTLDHAALVTRHRAQADRRHRRRRRPRGRRRGVRRDRAHATLASRDDARR